MLMVSINPTHTQTKRKNLNKEITLKKIHYTQYTILDNIV